MVACPLIQSNINLVTAMFDGYISWESRIKTRNITWSPSWYTFGKTDVRIPFAPGFATPVNKWGTPQVKWQAVQNVHHSLLFGHYCPLMMTCHLHSCCYHSWVWLHPLTLVLVCSSSKSSLDPQIQDSLVCSVRIYLDVKEKVSQIAQQMQIYINANI